MNKKEYLSEKCKERYKVNKIIMEQKEKEIKNTLRNELFLSKNKISNKNKYNYLYQKHIFQKETNKSKEKNEKSNNLNLKFTLYKEKDKDNLSNKNSFSMNNQKYKFTPKNSTIGNTFNTNSNLFYSVKDKINKKLINKNTDDLLPKLSALKKLKSTDKLNLEKNEKIDNNGNMKILYLLK